VARNVMNRRSLGSPAVQDEGSPVRGKRASGNPQDWRKAAGGPAAGTWEAHPHSSGDRILAVLVRNWSVAAAPSNRRNGKRPDVTTGPDL
jgi:hypothetical protein